MDMYIVHRYMCLLVGVTACVQTFREARDRVARNANVDTSEDGFPALRFLDASVGFGFLRAIDWSTARHRCSCCF